MRNENARREKIDIRYRIGMRQTAMVSMVRLPTIALISEFQYLPVAITLMMK